MKNLQYTSIELSDNARYREHLLLCEDICADWSTALIWGYSKFMPTVRAYADGLCWQHICEHGEDFEYAPIGDWDRADWPALFEKYVTPGTIFDYVPGALKERWEAIFPGQFTTTTNRDKWDYIYDLQRFAMGSETQRRHVRRFHELYEHTVVPITSANVDEVLALNNYSERRIRKESALGTDFTELDEDDKAMCHILNHIDSFDTIEGIILRARGRNISFMIWDVVDDRINCLFNRNNHEFEGVHDTAIEELCKINLIKGRRWVNYTCDAGYEGLRKAKMIRKPERLLEKYRMVWKNSL